MSSEPSLFRVASQWLVGVALAITVSGFLFAVAVIQVTSRDTGELIHRRAAAALTDIDQTLPGIESKLPEAAGTAQGDTVLIPDYPIPIELTKQEATTLKGADLRQRILDESGRRLYEDGMSLWANGDPAGRQQIDDVSTTGVLYRGLGLVRDSTYTYAMIFAVLFAGLGLILGVVLGFGIRSGYMRLLAAGGVLLAASMPGLAAAVAVRFAFKSAQTDADSFVDAMMQLGIDTIWLPIRMYLSLSMVGFAIVGIALTCMWWDSRPRPQPVGAGDLPPASGSPDAGSGLN